MLTRDQFDVLVKLSEEGLATPRQLEQIEPYRARRAVLFASGFGSRMLPITVNTPKPLVRVNGKRIIETILDALLALDIEEITIVRGYLADEFDILLKKYPMVRFVDNPLFEVTNNISSAAAAAETDLHIFENAYVFESDLFLKNPAILKKYQWQSNYLGVPVEETADWCFDVHENLIMDLHKGGENCFHMYGISYWSKEDGGKLASDLLDSFAQEENRQRFWDDVPCVIKRENYRIEMRECSFDDIDEIDSFEELCGIDERYVSPC